MIGELEEGRAKGMGFVVEVEIVDMRRSIHCCSSSRDVDKHIVILARHGLTNAVHQ